jgi:hypothetical protein
MATLKNLTPSTARAIRNLIEKCENPSCPNKNNLHVHHIDGNRENNVQSNLIVLCGDCHKKIAHVGPLSKTKQKQITQKRSKKNKSGVQTILKKAVDRQRGNISQKEYNDFMGGFMKGGEVTIGGKKYRLY